MVIPTAGGGTTRPLGFSSGLSTESQTGPVLQPARLFKPEDGVGTPTWTLKEPPVGFLASGRFTHGGSHRPGGPGAQNQSFTRLMQGNGHKIGCMAQAYSFCSANIHVNNINQN